MPVAEGRPHRVMIRRHSVLVRLTHWINALCLAFLLMTGLQIFNAHPQLYLGKYGADADTPIIDIGARGNDEAPSGFVRIGPITIPSTGIFGISYANGHTQERAFPAWATLPSYRDLGTGRRWHFFFAWMLVLNGLLYMLYGIIAGHFRRDLAPAADQMSLAHLKQELTDHAHLRFPKGNEARRYNLLQKLAYLSVILLLLPLMIATGLTMSPGFDAAFAWLADFFGGRQTARTIHFITASLLVAFAFIHIFMVLVSGVWNNLRSMITGRYAIEQPGDIQ